MQYLIRQSMLYCRVDYLTYYVAVLPRSLSLLSISNGQVADPACRVYSQYSGDDCMQPNELCEY